MCLGRDYSIVVSKMQELHLTGFRIPAYHTIYLVLISELKHQQKPQNGAAVRAGHTDLDRIDSS